MELFITVPQTADTAGNVECGVFCQVRSQAPVLGDSEWRERKYLLNPPSCKTTHTHPLYVFTVSTVLYT